MLSACRVFVRHAHVLKGEFGKPIAIKVGDYAEMERSFSSEDVESFAKLSGDHNPIHLSDDAAAKFKFGRRIVHGIVTGSLFGTIFGTQVPGSIYVNQTLSFRAPVFLDEKVRARVEVINVRETKRLVVCKTTCHKLDGTLVVEGEACVLVPNLTQTPQ
eukprot:GILJ01010249.1.p1 GENE.GILJ01010249.1~~GILJ01010249.1.p1  ORF type:complete len:159 (+),score=12.71 GILJ01010249.1:28-504(+)